MRSWNRYAKINVKLLVILILVVGALGTSLLAARQIRRSILSKKSLEAGLAAYDNKDWSGACKNFKEYLGRNPDDIEILRKFAHARLSIRPLEGNALSEAIMAYRRVMQLSPTDEVAFDKLVMLYNSVHNYDELAYISRTRLEHVPNDIKATLWQADALINMKKTEQARQILVEFIKDLESTSEKHEEYVQACVRMSKILGDIGSTDTEKEALQWLNKAAEYSPESVDAFAYRARFFRVTPGINGMSTSERLLAARKDLEAADNLKTEDPRVRIFLTTEWIAQGDFNRAEAEIHAVDNLPQEKLQEYFFDTKGWVVVRFLLVSELSMRRGDVTDAASLADEVLSKLTEDRHRVQVLPSAVSLYVFAGNAQQARNCLDEYLDALHTLNEDTPDSKLKIAYLQSLVAKSEGKPYVVIDMLQSVAMDSSSFPELWRLLAEAYSRTSQTRRAIDALTNYLKFYPGDFEMTIQLAREYFTLGNWNRASEIAELAESLNPDNIIAKLLRIEADIHTAIGRFDEIDKTRLEELADELNQLRQEHPDDIKIRILQAAIAVNLGQTDKAQEQLNSAIEECEQTLSAEMQLVNFYHTSGRKAEAISLCEESCKRHPGIAEPWLCLLDIYTADRDYDSARNCLEQALEAISDPKEKRSISLRLATIELLHGDRAKGIDILNNLAAQDEEDLQARLLLLGTREIQEDSATAEKLIEQIKKIEGTSGLWWRLYQASLWLSSDQWRSKQRDIAGLLQYCISADPAWSAPVLLMSDMYEKLEDFTGAEDICRQALTHNPSAIDVADKLLLMLENQGRFSEAENVLRHVNMGDQTANAWNIRMALRMGDISKAIDELKLRVSNNEKDVASRIQLARLVYQHTRDSNEALAYLKDAEDMVSGSSMALIGVKASILREDGRPEEAKRIIDDYVAAHDDFNAYWMRALYLTVEGDFELAEKDYKKLIVFPDVGIKGYQLLSNFYAHNKKLDKAVATLEEGIKAFPSDAVLERMIMKLLFVQGPQQDRQRALEILASLEKQFPQDPELIRYRTLELLENPTPQSLTTARENLEDVIKLEPAAIDAYLMLIDIAMKQNDYEKARNYAIQALGSNPNNNALMAARGRIELAVGNSQMAAELAHMVFQKDPNNAVAQKVLVEAALDGRDGNLLKEAQTLVESAVDSDPLNEEMLIFQAHVSAALEQPQNAIPGLESYCQTENGSASIPALVTLADLYRLAGDIQKAQKTIERAEDVDSENQAVVHSKFLQLVAQKRFEELKQISSAYISAKNQNPELVLNAAAILVSLSSKELKEEGLKLFEHVVSLTPESINARLGWASAVYQMGNVESAESMYKELLELYPNDIRILNDLAWILQKHNRQYEEALGLANKGLNLAPGDLHLLDTRGTILSNMENRLDDAKEDFQKIVELLPSDSREKARALLKLGRICVKLSDLDQAKRHFKRALEIDKRHNVFSPAEQSEIKGIIG